MNWGVAPLPGGDFVVVEDNPFRVYKRRIPVTYSPADPTDPDLETPDCFEDKAD